MKIRKDDSLWKGILEDIFDDFLIFIFRNDAAQFDFEKGFEFLNKELSQIFPIDDNAAYPKFVDKLVKVYTRDSREEWILVHVEVQGYQDTGFARRMFTYFYRILDKFNRPVTCIAIFTGHDKTLPEQQYEYNFLGTTNYFNYNVYNIVSQDFEALDLDGNPFSIVVQSVLVALQKSELGDDEILALYKNIAKKLLMKKITPAKTRAIMNFLKYYVNFEKKENISKFEEEIKILTNNNFTMGIEELLIERATRQGREEGKALIVKNLLEQTDFDDEKIASIAAVDKAFVEKIKAGINS